ncbi:hypothetical protein RJI07_02995 [Mycoplasmatota bacterium WC30]
MYCKNCGQEISGNEKFCGLCGQQIEEGNQQQTDSFQSNYTRKTFTKSADYNTELICGILAVVLSSLNYAGIPFVHIIGIIFGSVVISKVKKDKLANRNYSNTGYITGILGVVLGSIAFVYGVVYSIQML